MLDIHMIPITMEDTVKKGRNLFDSNAVGPCSISKIYPK